MIRIQIKAIALALLIALGVAAPAFAAPTITLSPAVLNTPNIGKVVESNPTSTAVFRVDAATGSVTRTSGTLVRIGAGTVTVPSYTVTCTNGGTGTPNRCGGGLTSVVITISAGSGSASALISAINVAVTNGPGTTTCSSANQNTATVTVTCSNITLITSGSETVATIKVGMDMRVQASNPSGPQTLSYTIATNP